MDPSNRFAFLERSRRNDEEGKEVSGLKCEMKTFEARYNSRGERVTLQVGMKSIDSDRRSDHASAFVLTRFYDRYAELEKTSLDIISPYVKKALQETIVRYPGVNFHAKVVTIEAPLKCLFHYRKELQEYGYDLKNKDHQDHVFFLLEYMHQVLAHETDRWYNLMELKGVARRLDFASLWMAFRPGSLVYTQTDGTERVLKLGDMTRCDCPNPYCWQRRWVVTAMELAFDEDSHGYVNYYFMIYPYDGYMTLDSLNIFPLEYHKRKDEIIAALVERGKRLVSLQGIHYRSYDGVAEALSPWRINSMFGEEDEFPLQSVMIKGRVMIDSKTFAMVKASNKIEINEELDLEKTDDQGAAHPRLTDEDFLICTYKVPGFCFTTKRWCIFQVALIDEIEFNSQAFQTLLLPQHQKDMIHSLVKVHSSDGTGFDDLIKGKGKGLVFLLHGVPGTGKTLTAESVADYTKRPLYTVNCGELGVNVRSVEENLSDALRLATTWNAIVLIDEADIFLEARGPNDLERNGLVSSKYIRSGTPRQKCTSKVNESISALLEYYQGILILTTNRISVFDLAFKSRIHLAIKYHALPPRSRRDLWKVFITSASSDTTPEWLDGEVLDRLAAEQINGRQIGNTVRTAQNLAASEGCPLGIKHIDMSLSAMSMFEMDFAEDADDHALLEPRSKRRREH